MMIAANFRWLPTNQGLGRKAALELILPNGLRIHGMQYNENRGRCWIDLPRPVTPGHDGTPQRLTVLTFENAIAREEFQAEVLRAISAAFSEVLR